MDYYITLFRILTHSELRMMIIKKCIIYVTKYIILKKPTKPQNIKNAHFKKNNHYFGKMYILLSILSWMEFGFICQNLFINEWLLGIYLECANCQNYLHIKSTNNKLQ